MAEYLNIIVMSLFTSVLFFMCFNLGVLRDLLLILYTLFFSFVFIWVRGSYPRIRYDRLINLTWKGFLPFSLGIIILLIPVFFLVWCRAGMNG